MSTQIETLTKELIDQMQTEVSRNIVANFAATIESLRVRIAKLEDFNIRIAKLEAALAQPAVDKDFIENRIERWAANNFEQFFNEAFDAYGLSYKVERAIEYAIEDFDFGDNISEAVAKQMADRDFITQDDLIEFLNDRVRISVD